MNFELPPLPYSFHALEPSVSAKTLKFHYGKHHQKYIDTLNELTKGTSYENLSLEEIILKSHGREDKIYKNAAQVWNHTFMWNALSGKKAKPSPKLSKILAKEFGAFETFKEKFEKEAVSLFGSGYVWLIKDQKGKLRIRALNNAESPLLKNEIPLFTCDVWEHSYYLDYQNERPQYVKKFWNIINWDFVEQNLNRKSAITFEDLKTLSSKSKGKQKITRPPKYSSHKQTSEATTSFN